MEEMQFLLKVNISASLVENEKVFVAQIVHMNKKVSFAPEFNTAYMLEFFANQFVKNNGEINYKIISKRDAKELGGLVKKEIIGTNSIINMFGSEEWQFALTIDFHKPSEGMKILQVRTGDIAQTKNLQYESFLLTGIEDSDIKIFYEGYSL